MDSSDLPADFYRMTPRAQEAVWQAANRMQAWAILHPSADTQGLMRDEFEDLARAALNMPTLMESEL